MTWSSEASGVSGIISSSNSLVGSHAGDSVGYSVTPLTNGNYVVDSYNWNGGTNGYGAVTWGSGTSGVTGVVSAVNSLVGSNPGDLVGSGGVKALSNGNYVVSSFNWNGNEGAVTFGCGSASNACGANGVTAPSPPPTRLWALMATIMWAGTKTWI